MDKIKKDKHIDRDAHESIENRGLNISKRSFITAIVVIFLLMILTYALTFIIPSGEYFRTTDASGNIIIDTKSGFFEVEAGISFWKWILSPILVLGATGSASLIAVIVFLLVIGAVFNSLEKCGMMRYMLDKITVRFANQRFKLMAVIVLFFMGIGSFIGSFEECVPLVPIVVALAVSLGWDPITGMAMSVLATGCGFAAGVSNPFTIGVAQRLAGVPVFSGMSLRLVAFILIYLLLMLFITRHAKKIDRNIKIEKDDFVQNGKMDRALISFATILGIGMGVILLSGFVEVIQSYTMIIVALMFLIAGITSTLVSGMKLKELFKTFLSGLINILPAVLMILMAASIKYTLEEAKILDTILHYAVLTAANMPRWSVILFIYFIVLVMNFFISSGSAKAFLLIPLIVPIAQVFGISAQLSILAYAFGDGFSNVFYPTNAVLLISLGLAGVSYGQWAKWSIKFHALNLLLTSGLLLLGLAVGY